MQWFKAAIRSRWRDAKALIQAGVVGQSHVSDRKVSEMERPSWLGTVYTEPRVMVALRDLCPPGGVVFDVGCNFGGLSVAMSRVVGPRGVVCAFEANPSIASRCQAELNGAGCTNAQIYWGAIYSRSYEKVDLYISANGVSDSIYNRPSDDAISVPTIALDDFVAQTGLVPQLVKMDIEGAEPDALAGFMQTIGKHAPIFILEQQPQDSRCLDLLTQFGYRAVDLSTYAIVNAMSDLPGDTIVTDILYARPEQLASTPYVTSVEKVADIAGTSFTRNGSSLVSHSVPLPAGRYMVHAEFDVDVAEDFEAFVGVMRSSDGEVLMRHHGGLHALSRLANRWVFDAPGGDVVVFFELRGQFPNRIDIKNVCISEAVSFRGQKRLFI